MPLSTKWTNNFSFNDSSRAVTVILVHKCIYLITLSNFLYLLITSFHKQRANTYNENKIFFTSEVIIVWLILSIMLADIMREDLYGFTNRIPVILLGVLFGWSKDNIKNKITKDYVILLCFIFALGIFFAWRTSIKGMYLVVPVSNCCIPNLLMTVSWVPLMALLFEKRLLKGCLLKIFEFFGAITFELYCLQEWIGNHLVYGIEAKLHYPILVNLVNFTITILGAFILHKLIELLFGLTGRLSKKEAQKQ